MTKQQLAKIKARLRGVCVAPWYESNQAEFDSCAPADMRALLLHITELEDALQSLLDDACRRIANRIEKLEAVRAMIARNGHRPWITSYQGDDLCINCWKLGNPHLSDCVYEALDALLDETTR